MPIISSIKKAFPSFSSPKPFHKLPILKLPSVSSADSSAIPGKILAAPLRIPPGPPRITDGVEFETIPTEKPADPPPPTPGPEFRRPPGPSPPAPEGPRPRPPMPSAPGEPVAFLPHGPDVTPLKPPEPHPPPPREPDIPPHVMGSDGLVFY